MIVVDTNVVVHFITDGRATEDAAALFDEDGEWAAPRILMSEFRNVLVGMIRRGAITSDRAKVMSERAAAILADRITPVESAQVLDVAIECDLTAYDAEFVALARTLDVPLVTLDGGILDGAPDVAVRLRAFLDAS
ncbi:MAG: type II toxin-antitoxin system VapC family toxin [Chloroflexi bacterium]|nr:type II toxin-antitoxin system VapC family toxin [Chloroflexota bacterium]